MDVQVEPYKTEMAKVNVAGKQQTEFSKAQK